MSQRSVEVAKRLGWSAYLLVASFFVLYPACAAVAEGLDDLTVTPRDGGIDVTNILMGAAVISVLVEALRFILAPLRRGKPLHPVAKHALRALPLVIGIVAGVAGAAPGVTDGSDPHLVGGIACGCISTIWGGSLVGYIRDRVAALRGKA